MFASGDGPLIAMFMLFGSLTLVFASKKNNKPDEGKKE